MRLAHLLSVALVAASNMDLASAQTFPNRLIRIVTSEIGGANDQAARLIAPGISALGQPVIIENLSADNRNQAVLRAAPDGHTFLVINSSLWITPLTRKVPYDLKDYAVVTIVSNEPNLLVVTPSLPVKSVKELIALAKARPGELNHTLGSIGGIGHLAMTSLMLMTGTKIELVTYKSDSQELSELMSGQVQMSFQAIGLVPQYIKMGKLRALAVTSAQRTALAPGLPAIAETVPGFEYVAQRIVFVRADTPPAIMTRLNQEIVRWITRTDVKQKFFDAGGDVVGNSLEQATEVMKSDMAKWSKVIKDVGFKVE